MGRSSEGAAQFVPPSVRIDCGLMHLGSVARIQHLLRTMRVLARDDRIPKSLRWVAGVALLPIPGPIDEAVLVAVAPLFLLYRTPVREAWEATRD